MIANSTDPDIRRQLRRLRRVHRRNFRGTRGSRTPTLENGGTRGPSLLNAA